ncbi:MAG: hypothetical protein WC752_00870, partial [Patescibacteria group bacterium]
MPGEPTGERSERQRSRYLGLLEQAFQAWSNLPAETKGKFNPEWLINNYPNVYNWANKHGGINVLVVLASPELQAVFERQTREITSEQIALTKLEQAFQAWSQLPEEIRGKFNPEWLKANNYNLQNWATKHGGFSALVALASPELQAVFERQTREITSEQIALTKLEQAFQAWQALPEATRGKFNSSWLKNNDYYDVYNWAYTHGRIEALVAKASSELQAAFEMLEKKIKSEQIALTKLEQAFQAWQALPEATRGKFNRSWLKNN